MHIQHFQRGKLYAWSHQRGARVGRGAYEEKNCHCARVIAVAKTRGQLSLLMSLKHGSSNWELLEIKWKFPREVILCRVGEFYEAVGFDACILVEYAGLNPVGPTRFDTVPKAGCPVMNLRQTLDALTRNRFSVCVVEEVQGPNRARTRKERFISGHAHPGSPYVYGLAGDDIDVEFSEPVPVAGISRSARGYCFVSVLEAMQTYSVEDGLTEEAVVAKLRAQDSCSLFLHSSLRKNLSGSSRWGDFGEGGLLWGVCYGKYYEWFCGDFISQLLSKVRELYGLDPYQKFRNVTIPFEKKPRPLDLATATDIGVMPTEGIPSLLKVLLPSDTVCLCEIEGRKRNWVVPTLKETNQNSSVRKSGKVGMKLEIVGLVPYWINSLQEDAIQNTIQMQSLFLLTGPNGGGKSSILRSIGATALLGICGLMVPAEIAIIPDFDSIILHMGSYDSPADCKSSFQMEMSEMRSILCEATNRTLVLIDEICRGTEIHKGTCIAASIIEELDYIGCIGIISTHLHGLLDVSLNARDLLYKAMETKEINGHIKPTWKLIDGVCRESLAFETARREGIPEKIIGRAEQLYSPFNQDDTIGITDKSKSLTNGTTYSETVSYTGNHDDPTTCKHTILEEKIINFPTYSFSQTERPVNTVEVSDTKDSDQSERNLRLLKEAQKVFFTCQEKLLKHGHISQILPCTLIGAREKPPTTLTNSSCVYILQRPDGRFYVGETDDLAGRIRAHRSVEGMQTVPFLYIGVPGKSIARELETVLINKLRRLGFELVNKADQSHQNFGTSDFPPF